MNNKSTFTEILWDHLISGILCLTLTIAMFYSASCTIFGWEYKLPGSLTRDGDTTALAIVLGGIALIFSVMFFRNSRKNYGYIK